MIFALAILNAAAAQDDAEQATRQLKRLRSEIREFEKRLSESRNREADLLDELADFDREISLRRELIRKLEQEHDRTQKALEKTRKDLGLLQKNIDVTNRRLSFTTLERDSLAALVKRRAVYVYKYFQRDALKALLTSRTVVQMLVRQEFIRRIAAADRRNLIRLDEKNQELARLNERLAQEQARKRAKLEEYARTAAYKEGLIQEQNAEAELLAKRRSDRESLLQRIRRDQDLLRRQLEEKKLAAQRIENLIKSLETEREGLPAPPEVAWTPEIPFRELKGKMNWPTPGKVVARFGLQKHERLATVTENPGIDIQAQEGALVNCVCTGKVTRITWLRGYGNTVIVDHQDGYYTVYAHLGTINVREGQIVAAGEPIGRVGQTGSLEGPRLHFEIWVKREKQDPLSWLVPR